MSRTFTALLALCALGAYLVSGAAYADVALTCSTPASGSIGSCAWPGGFKAVEYSALTPDTQLIRCPNPPGEANMHPANCFGTWARFADIAAADLVLVCRGATLTTPLSNCTPVTAGQAAMTAVRFKSSISGAVPPPPPACTTPKPTDDNRPGFCPAGLIVSWSQLRTYAAVPAPACWAAGEWLPAAAPADGCVVAPWVKSPPMRCSAKFPADVRVSIGIPDSVIVAQCEDAQGYQIRGYAGDARDLAHLATCAREADVDASLGIEGLAKSSKAQQDALYNKCITGPMTPSQQAIYDEIRAKHGWRFVVSGSTTTPVYLRNADGSRGARLAINGVNQSIAAGKVCNGGARLTGSTRYHVVGGHPSTTGVTLPANTYAQCTLKKPPTTGW
jgi:hypothetical protein